jgi:AAA domain-containing protein
VTDLPTSEYLNQARNNARLNALRDGNGRLQRLDVDQLLANPVPAIDWLWSGYIERGTICQLHGAGGAGKSILAAALVRAACSAYPFLGRDTWPSRSVIVDGENPTPEIHRRLERLAYQGLGDHVSYFQASEAIFGDLDEAEDMLRVLVEEAIADLVVLDSQRARSGTAKRTRRRPCGRSCRCFDESRTRQARRCCSCITTTAAAVSAAPAT